jgi:hypothetical protein
MCYIILRLFSRMYLKLLPTVPMSARGYQSTTDPSSGPYTEANRSVAEPLALLYSRFEKL